ncbi:hypothetical protein [Paenibacillus andongensis]|uniref:hypothetical protein n=1 Tax=Paenibacillus andongensis TaxID=2975482 RepID=UPI0021BA7FD9|nr:hypothetical protein [Paenibacillus andongensis]
MRKEKKAFSKKEKIVGAIASTAMMAVPFMVAPAQQGYANNETPYVTPSATPVDKIHTIVLPVGGKKYIDLHNLYSAYEFEVISSNPNIASGNNSLLNYGILEINANSIGSSSTTGYATFTVTVIPYESETSYTDTFNVVIVPNSGTGTGNFANFNIKNVVNVLEEFPTNFTDKSSIHELMSHIDLASTTIKKEDPFNQLGNLPPVSKNNPNAFETILGMEANVNAYDENLSSFNINNYYEDPDYNPDVYSELGVIFTTSGNEYIQVNNTPNGQTLTPLKPIYTPINLPVVVYDGNGGVVSTSIPIIVKPSEVFELDEHASITLDLHNYFSNLDADSYFDYDILDSYEEDNVGNPPEIDGTQVTLTARYGVYKFKSMKADTEQESKYFIVKNNYDDLYTNHLSKSYLYENSTLEIDLDQMFPQSETSTVQYSVYHENPSVTSITYGFSNGHTLYFSANEYAADNVEIEEAQAPNYFTVIAKDDSRHLTYVDRVNIAPRSFYGTIYADKLFDWDSEGPDVVVNSTTPGFDFVLNDSNYQYGSGVYVQLSGNNSGSSSTTIILKLSNGSIVYKLPYNNN